MTSPGVNKKKILFCYISLFFLVFDLYLPGMGPVGSVFISLLVESRTII